MGSGTDDGWKSRSTTFSAAPAKGTKYDKGKPRISLIPREFTEEVAKAFTYGAYKYGEQNFRGGIEVTRLLDAALRHIIAFTDGETIDPESGINHLGHAGASLAMIMVMLTHNPELDNRWRKNENTDV